jgi:hypothetical protein
MEGEGTGFFLFPFIRGKGGGNNVIKITGYHFSNILLILSFLCLPKVKRDKSKYQECRFM